MFNDSFKYYKARKHPPDLKNVIDVLDPNCQNIKKKVVHHNNELKEISLGLKCTKIWNIYELDLIPGLIFIQNPFTASGQKYWILKCLKEYTKKPSVLNIDTHNILSGTESWWETCHSSPENKSLLSKLRWATLGYHHNWDTKFYTEDSKTVMPDELGNLTNYFAEVLGYQDFKAEAAIINYYRMNSTLAGHTDHSEVFLEAPLFSISFGQSAIFLVGGLKREDQAHAILLRSGDVVVMSGASRLRYHGVPRILFSDFHPWDSTDSSLVVDNDWEKVQMYISEARINMNIRQVLKNGQKTL